MVDSRQEPLLQTALNQQHRQLQARLVSFAGWEMPVQYSGVVREHQMVRTVAGLFDVSHMGRVLVRGGTASAAVGALIANDLSAVAEGVGVYSCCCNDEGGIVDDLIAYKLGDAEVLVVCNASNRSKIVGLFSRHSAGCTVEDITSETVLVAVQGPRASEVLVAAGLPPDIDQRLRPFGVERQQLGATEVVVARTGYTGEDGFEIMAPAGCADELWQRLLTQSVKLGGGPVGLAARDTLRLEAALRLYGNELSEDVNPFEAGLGWTVSLQAGEFVGKAALMNIKAAPLRRKLVGFEMVGRGIARSGYTLHEPGGPPIGRCTSGSSSPTLGCAIGLGYLAVDYARVGQPLEVDCRGRRIEAKVVKLPFYRRSQPGGNRP